MMRTEYRTCFHTLYDEKNKKIILNENFHGFQSKYDHMILKDKPSFTTQDNFS